MPLEPALNYQNEADFTSRFLVPLLRRLGYSVVAEYHGQREFGKDLVFGEIDRFGEVAYHGLQSKYQDSISQADSEGLIEDCKQAFRHPFRHPNTGAEHRIASFVVANAGSISDNARANFFMAATNAEHGGAVKMLDGKALLSLDRWATINRVEHVGEILSGLRFELAANASQIYLIRKGLNIFIEDRKDGKPPTATVPANRLRLVAIEHYLQKPFLPSQISSDNANTYWFLSSTAVNGMLTTLASTFSFSTETMILRAQRILSHLDPIELYGNELIKSVTAAQESLGTLAAS